MTRSSPLKAEGHPGEVLAAFLKLGLTAFGGPIAHIGYFRQAFVVRLGWLDETAFADLVALCQFLPGPASSQVGFAIGLRRAGPLGALAAWTGFTLPSALLMTAFGLGAAAMSGPLALGLIHGLKLVAVAIVAQAVYGMARTLAPDLRRAAIAVVAGGVVLLAAAGIGQIAAIALGALAGLFLCRRTTTGEPPPPTPTRLKPRTGLIALGVFLALLIGAPVAEALTGNPILARFAAFYRSGALVFGGGHVVLPLLKTAVVDPGWVNQDTFLAGYGLAQAVPGPLFTFSAFLGAVMRGPPSGVAGAVMALAAIFLPGLLILAAALPFWQGLRARPSARAAMAGANAAVVGVLAAALYTPVWTGAVFDVIDIAAVVVGALVLIALKAPPITVVLAGAALGVVRAMLG